MDFVRAECNPFSMSHGLSWAQIIYRGSVVVHACVLCVVGVKLSQIEIFVVFIVGSSGSSGRILIAAVM